MRVTIFIDDDVLEAAKQLALIEKRSVGKVISSLVRRTLSRPAEGRETVCRY